MSYSGINMASRALQADQRALEVTGQNIANVDVPGYSRQVAILRSVLGPGAAALDENGNPVAPGGGVDVALVQRSHAAWLDHAAAGLKAQMGQTSINDQTAGRVESLLAEPTDAGLQATMDRFLTAFGKLANRPDDSAARDGVLRAGEEVVNRFRQVTDGIASERQDVRNQARDNVAAINELAKQVADLSHMIGQAQAAGAAPNELLDQRDQLLQELTQRTGATVSGQQGGDVVVSLGGTTLVQGQHAEAIDLAPSSPLSVVLRSTGQAVSIPGGELRAQQDWTNTNLPAYQSRLNAVRDGFAATVNSLHQLGKDATGAIGEALFLADSGGNLVVNPSILADVRKVVAGDGTAGNGSVALAIANSRTAPGSALPQYQSLVADIGTQASESRRLSDQSRASLQQIQSVQASESGVNLDEELAQMVSLQHAYAASARLLTTYDDMLTTLIQHTGG